MQSGAIVRNEGDVPAGGTFTVAPGAEVVVYGALNRRCGVPDFEDVLASHASPKYGRLMDRGIGVRYSKKCGPRSRVRAVGYVASPDAAGKVDQFEIYGDAVKVNITQ